MRRLLLLLLLSAPCFAATCGNTVQGGTTDSGSANIIITTKCTLPISATVSTVSFWSSGSVNANLAIYASTSSGCNGTNPCPDTKICETGQFAASAGLNTVAISGCGTLSAADYWVASIVSGGSIYDNAVSNSLYSRNAGACCTFISPLGGFQGNLEYPQYFTYAAAGATTRKRVQVISR